MEYVKNILCVNKKWLVEETGILTEHVYNHLVSRKQITVVRRGGGLNNTVEVAYDSIPQRFRDLIEKQYGDVRKGITTNILVDKIEQDAKATEFFSDYLLPNKRHLPAKVQLEYYNNAILLNACNRMINDRSSFRRSRSGNAPRIWDELSRAIEDLTSATYPHTLPSHPRRLELRYKLYMSEGYKSLIHKNFCNQSAAKVNDDIKESILTELIADPRNLDNEQVRGCYNTIAERMNWKQITASAIAVWRDKLDIVTHPGRRGGNDFMNNKAMQVKRSKPTSPLYYWTMDGWDAELLYQKFENGRTTYHNRLTVVVVLDPCVNYPVGFAIGTHETPELIKAALRNAVDHTAELFGQRYRTHQLQSDHYAIKALTPLYEGMAEKVTPARVKNAKTKVVEPYFHYINKKYCQIMPNWSGFGITSKKESQPNVDFLNKYNKNFPELEGCVEQIARIMALEREDKKSRYLDLWGKTADTDKLPLSWSNYLYYFGAETGYQNMLQGSGLLMSIEGVKHSYDCFDLSFRNHASVRWSVKYDPSNTSKVLAINEDGTLRYELEEKYIQPMALKDRRPGDYAELSRVKSYNSELIESITEQRKTTATAVTELFDSNPKLNDTLTKLILVDSKGQHKNERNENRLGAAAATKRLKIVAPQFEDQPTDEDDDIFKMI